MNNKSINLGNLILAILSYAAMITMNTLAIVLPLNGRSTKELSDKYVNLFVPAGQTFAIWSVIFLLLLLFVLKIGIDFFGKKNTNFSQKSINLFIISNLLNGSWIIAWHYEQVLVSVLIMLSLLITLILLFIEIQKIKTNDFLSNLSLKTLPSVYMGWISVATIANITALLVNNNWGGFGISETCWTITMILIASILGIYITFLKGSKPYTIVLIWAFYGIYLKRSIDPNTSDISTFSLFCIGLLTVILFLSFYKNRKTVL